MKRRPWSLHFSATPRISNRIGFTRGRRSFYLDINPCSVTKGVPNPPPFARAIPFSTRDQHFSSIFICSGEQRATSNDHREGERSNPSSSAAIDFIPLQPERKGIIIIFPAGHLANAVSIRQLGRRNFIPSTVYGKRTSNFPYFIRPSDQPSRGAGSLNSQHLICTQRPYRCIRFAHNRAGLCAGRSAIPEVCQLIRAARTNAATARSPITHYSRYTPFCRSPVYLLCSEPDRFARVSPSINSISLCRGILATLFT